MRRGLLPYALALLLGTSTALLAACGGSTKGGIPSASAGELKSQITDVGQAVDGGRCDEVPGQLRQVDQGIDQLPKTTDDQLVSALRDGADRLRREAIDECESDSGTETTTTETTAQEPDTDTTDTAPDATDTTDAPPTETTEIPDTTVPEEPPPPPEDPQPAPPPVTPPPVAPTPPPPPPVSPGGGVTPDIPPG